MLELGCEKTTVGKYGLITRLLLGEIWGTIQQSWVDAVIEVFGHRLLTTSCHVVGAVRFERPKRISRASTNEWVLYTHNKGMDACWRLSAFHTTVVRLSCLQIANRYGVTRLRACQGCILYCTSSLGLPKRQQQPLIS